MSKVHSRILFAALSEFKEINEKLLDCLEPEVLDESEFANEVTELLLEWDEVIVVTLGMRNAFCRHHHDLNFHDADLKWGPTQVVSKATDDTKDEYPSEK